jgi:hypothetical protein
MNMLRILSLVAALCIPTVAKSETPWSSPGSACVPDHATIANNRAVVGPALVRHANNNVDKIVLNCAIQAFNLADTDWALMLDYEDSTGAGEGAMVRGRLYKMALGGGDPEPVATKNSNSEPIVTRNLMAQPFEHTFDFDTYVYWVRVELDRNTTNQTVILHAVSLFAGIIG